LHERTVVPQTDPNQPLPTPEWRKSDTGPAQPTFTTPMYDHLETNLPKHLMQFSDQPFGDDVPLFPRRELVSRYIDDYAAEVKPQIKFGTQVVNMELCSNPRDIWSVTSRNLFTDETTTAEYDAIAVCAGHYTAPFIPDYAGIRQWNEAYPGTIIHSKFWRSPEPYTGKKVIVVGTGASGTDMANQIAMVSKHPLLASQRAETQFATPGDPAEQMKMTVPAIARFLGPSERTRAVEFVDGHIEADIDAIVFATGYLYSFPYLPADQLGIIDDGMRIKGLYQHLFHRDHPSLAFFGMPFRIVPFPLSEVQAAVVARLWSGRLDLPEKQQMVDWEQNVLERTGNGRRFHYLDSPLDIFYIRYLYDWATRASGLPGKLPARWDDYHYWMRTHVLDMRRAFTEAGDAKKDVTTFEQIGFDFGEWKKDRTLEQKSKAEI
jgi:hypothetical protein